MSIGEDDLDAGELLAAFEFDAGVEQAAAVVKDRFRQPSRRRRANPQLASAEQVLQLERTVRARARDRPAGEQRLHPHRRRLRFNLDRRSRREMSTIGDYPSADPPSFGQRHCHRHVVGSDRHAADADAGCAGRVNHPRARLDAGRNPRAHGWNPDRDAAGVGIAG